MTINYNVTGNERKRLADYIAGFLGCDKKYLGAPSFAYQVGYIIVSKNGAISFDDRADSKEIENLLAELESEGFRAEEMETAAAAGQDVMETAEGEVGKTDSENIEGGVEVTPIKWTRRRDELFGLEYVSEDGRFVISKNDYGTTRWALEDKETGTVENCYTKSEAIADAEQRSKNTGPDGGKVESFSEKTDGESYLAENTPKNGPECKESLTVEELPREAEKATQGKISGLTVAVPLDKVHVGNLTNLLDAKGSLIRKALGIPEIPIMVSGDEVSFPWFQVMPEPDEVQAYTHFISALCKMSVTQKRVTAREKDVVNEKYAFRCFLLRLGFIGNEYKAERKILLKNLAGSSAFKSGARKEAVGDEVSDQRNG